MGLFDFLGTDSPMFMASNKQDTPFNIDSSKFITPASAYPSLGSSGGKDSKFRIADLQEQQQNDAKAQGLVQGLVKKYGQDAPAIYRDPDFKEAQYLTSGGGWEARLMKEKMRESEDKVTATLHEKGNEQLGAFDIDNYYNTGKTQNNTIGDTFNSLIATPLSQMPDLEQHYNNLLTAGTKKDYNEFIDKEVTHLTGKSSNDIEEMRSYMKANPNATKEQFANYFGFDLQKDIQTFNNAYALVRTKYGTNQDEQAKALARDMSDAMDPKALKALEGDYVQSYSGASPSYDKLSPAMKSLYLKSYMDSKPGMNKSDAEDALRKELSSNFEAYKQQRILNSIIPKEERTSDTKEITKMGNFLQDYNEKLRSLKTKDELTGPYSAAYNKQIAPTKPIAAPTVQVKDKNGNYVDFTAKGTIAEYSGLNFNFDPGKTKFDANSVGTNFRVSGFDNDPKVALKGGLIDHIGASTQQTITSRDKYLELNKLGSSKGGIDLTPQQLNMIETGKGDNLTKEELDNLQSNGNLKMEDVVSTRVFIPRNEYIPDKIKALVRDDDGKVTEDDLYHTHWYRVFGYELNESIIDKDAVQYVDADSPAGKKYGTDGYFINGNMTVTPEDRLFIDRKIRASKSINISGGSQGENQEEDQGKVLQPDGTEKK